MSSPIPAREQLQHGRWMRANVAIASLFVAGILAIACMGGSGTKYEAAIKSAVNTVGNTHPKWQHPNPEITGSIGPAKMKSR